MELIIFLSVTGIIATGVGIWGAYQLYRQEEPNEEIQSAMKEAREGKNLQPVDTSSFDNFLDSCSK